MHFHVPYHPFQKHPNLHPAELLNLLLILLGVALAMLMAPVHLD